MSKELVIGSNRHETKVAILEEDQLVEIYFQRENEYSLAGSIHKGRVTRVLPGMQSAFVDLGLERDTFLYVSDFFEENPDIDTVDEKPVRNDRRDNEKRDRVQLARPAERAPSAPFIALPVIAAPVIDAESEVVPETSILPDDDVASAVEAVSPITEVEALTAPSEEARPAQGQRPPDGDRNFRGDRRGRRSRRRRSRGRGFPENKYAQPGAESSAAPLEPIEEQDEGAGEVEVFETEERDVIILPGESLAKYSRLTLSEKLDEHEPEAPESASSRAAEIQAEERAEQRAEAKEVAAESDSLELTDKIFSHHAESSSEEEDKIESVREESVASDERPSPFLVTGAEAIEIEQSVEQRDAPIPEPIQRQAGQFAEDPHEEADAEFENELPDGAFVEDGFSETEAIEITPTPVLSQALPASGEQAQTATVRDPGDRYPHRVSRRMRRRRGGNRFQGSGSPEAGSDTRTAPTALATGSAPAPDVETPTVLQLRIPERNRDPRPQGINEQRSAESEESRSLAVTEQRQERFGDREERALPSIAELLKPGQEIIVQIAKEPLGQKGARITSHIALPGRYVVFMPSVSHLGVSRKIASDEERQRLKRILQAHRAGTTGGFIVRTAGEGVPEPEIAADMDFLYKSWLDIRQKAEKRPAPALLHCDLDIVQRLLRDQVTDEFKAIWVDNEDMYENILGFLQRFQPALVNRVKMYTRQAPIFDAFGITQELEKALRPKVWLKSGGYIVINQTEALVAIDINTGKYVGKSNRLEDTIVKTNTEAVKEIVRQIRLRDLGGIIVVDFIDMDERKNRQKVMQVLEEAMRGDRAPSKILQFNDFGLVAITRKRVKQSLERTLCSPCPYCEGAGYVKSVQTVIGEILIEAQKIARAIEGKDVLLRVHPEVAKVLKGNDNKFLEEMEEILGRPVLVKGDPALHLEKFDLG